MRCWKMRCGDIWRCWGAKSFYSKLIRLWYQSKSPLAVLEKLNENPEWSAQKLAEEWHFICNAQEEDSVILRGDSKGTFSGDCFLARHSGEFGSTNVCYDFWDWGYFFQFGEKSSAPKLKLAVKEYERTMISCWNYATIDDLHVLCDRYWIDYVLYQLNKDELDIDNDFIGDNWYIGIDWEKECFCGYYLYTGCLRGGTRAKPNESCWHKRKCSSLLTYEELEEIYYSTPVLAELNSHPEEYFQSLAAHLVQDSLMLNLRRINDSCVSFSRDIYFDTSISLRASWSCGK